MAGGESWLQSDGVRERKKKERSESPVDRVKMEIAMELGLADKVRQLGWAGLSSAESGRVGGMMTKRLRAMGLLPPARRVRVAQAAEGASASG